MSKNLDAALATIDAMLDEILDVGKQSSPEPACDHETGRYVVGGRENASVSGYETLARDGSLDTRPTVQEEGYPNLYHGTYVDFPRRKPFGREPYRRIAGADGHLRKLRPFRGNSMWAMIHDRGNPLFHTQRLDAYYSHGLRRLTTITDVYIVYSYYTPIAWVWNQLPIPFAVDLDAYCGHGPRRRGLLRCIPDVSYSVTTSKHQGYARACLPGLDELDLVPDRDV